MTYLLQKGVRQSTPSTQQNKNLKPTTTRFNSPDETVVTATRIVLWDFSLKRNVVGFYYSYPFHNLSYQTVVGDHKKVYCSDFTFSGTQL